MKISRLPILMAALVLAIHARAAVTLTKEDHAGKPVYRLDNGRVALVVDPARGGGVVSYRDRLGGDVELVPAAAPSGLCLDHFQSQAFPGEMLGATYEVTDQKNDPQACSLAVRYRVTGQWAGSEDEKLRDLLLEKTYTLRADSPALECRIRLTAPKKESKLFAYWQQHIFFAGGQYDRLTDRSFRPSLRGVRVKAGDNWGDTGAEEFLRDITAGWIALLDTQRRTGLVVLSDYNELEVLYACGGNTTIEPMYRLTYLPAGRSVEYATYVVPVVGLDNVVAATPDYIAGYQMKTNGKGAGTVAFALLRSVNAPTGLTLQVSLNNVEKPAEATAVGTMAFGPLSDQVRTRELAFQNAGDDPLALNVVTEAKEPGGTTVAGRFAEYFNGTYRWGENIQVDMVTPVWRGERPKQKLTLIKPEPLKLKTVPGQPRFWYAEGLLDDGYHLTAAAEMSYFSGGAERRDRAFVQTTLWGARLSSFPYDYEQLLGYDLLILGGVKEETLGNIGQEMLCDYVNAGGGIIMLGGPSAYGASRLRGTPLAEVLPVTMAATPFDLVKPANDTVKPTAAGASLLEDHDWSAAPRALYVHRVEVKSWGKTLLEVDGHPFLVVGEVGPKKARVACLMGVPMGEFDRQQTPFWEWHDWEYLMRQVIWWVMKDEARFTHEGW